MTILVVEDDLDVSRAIQCYIHSFAPGVIFIEAIDARNGLSITDNTVLDVILLDLCLPDSPSPKETIYSFSSVMKRVPTVVITGLSDSEIGAYAIEHGAKRYVLKGDMKEMRSAFQEVLKIG